TVWRLDERASLLERVDAPQASLSEQQLSLRDAQVTATGERLNHRAPIYKIETNLSSADLRERVTPPESISLWDLPRFIELAEAAGLPTVRYHIRFHDLCSMPLKLVAMVLIAGLFSLKPMRTGGAFRLLLSSIVAGFLLYMISEISTALGEAGSAPVALAAWTPALVATMIAIAGLLQFEDG
ncbi:MAG: LptF/LptG family permease, partial [Pseudomonadota bacterium]